MARKTILKDELKREAVRGAAQGVGVATAATAGLLAGGLGHILLGAVAKGVSKLGIVRKLFF